MSHISRCQYPGCDFDAMRLVGTALLGYYPMCLMHTREFCNSPYGHMCWIVDNRQDKFRRTTSATFTTYGLGVDPYETEPSRTYRL